MRSDPLRTYALANRATLILILALLSIASPVFGSDLAKSFKEAVRLGVAQEGAPSTKDYFTNTLLPYYSQEYGPVLHSCFANISKPDLTKFSFVVAMGADGKMLRLYHDRETNMFRCMRVRLKNDSFPPPPEVPYYLYIEMTLSE